MIEMRSPRITQIELADLSASPVGKCDSYRFDFFGQEGCHYTVRHATLIANTFWRPSREALLRLRYVPSPPSR
jgi:hypothetical protein